MNMQKSQIKSWTNGNIRDLLKVSHGKDQKAIIAENGTYSIYGSGGVIGSSNNFIYDKSSVLIGRKGTIDKPIFVSEPFWVVDTMFFTKINEDVNPKWVYYYFQTIPWQKYNEATSIPSLSASTVHQIKVQIPPLPEQKKIAEILSTWDEAIETNKRLLASIEKHRASQLKNYFMKTKSSSTNKSLEELEDSDSIKLGRGRVISRDEMKLSKGLFPVYSSSIKNNGLMGYLDEYLFDEEMITWSIDGGGNFFYRDKHKFSVTNVSGFMRIIDDNIKPYFLANQLQYLHSKLVFDYQTKAHPSVIRSLYKVQIPTLNEQTRFEFLFKSIDKQIEKINQYINELQKQKQGLMQRLLTGKVRVKLD